MFNYGYAILFALLGFFGAAASEPHLKDPAATPKWTWSLAPFAWVFNLVGIGAVIYFAFTFGLFWGFVSFVEIVVGAMIWGMLRVKAG